MGIIYNDAMVELVIVDDDIFNKVLEFAGNRTTETPTFITVNHSVITPHNYDSEKQKKVIDYKDIALIVLSLVLIVIIFVIITRKFCLSDTENEDETQKQMTQLNYWNNIKQ